MGGTYLGVASLAASVSGYGIADTSRRLLEQRLAFSEHRDREGRRVEVKIQPSTDKIITLEGLLWNGAGQLQLSSILRRQLLGQWSPRL
jgi:hypothetical protein